MVKNYILDTNVLIHDPKCIHKFQDNTVIIPITVLEELDNLKKREGMVGHHARLVAREICNLKNLGDLHEGVTLKNGGKLKIELNHMNLSVLPDGMDTSKNDTKILAVAKNIENSFKDTQTILITKDLYVKIKGSALNLTVEDYENDKIEIEKIYNGYRELSMTSKQIDEIYRGKGIESPISLYPNEFLHIKAIDSSQEILAKYSKGKIVPLEYANTKAWGLTPRNKEQKMAFELLMDPDVHFVTIAGGAGSGKTILSVSVALQKVIEEQAFKKIVLVKPVVPAGNDIGYLAGSENEKLKPWMGSYYDAVENLTSKNVENFLEYFRDKGIIETKTFTYMRGRTFNNSFVIVDEAQEITPHLAKLMLTRAGFNSKFVFLGDPSDNQIDNTLVDSKSNGLVYTIEKMKEYSITGHVTLKKVERSLLAALAESSM